jgi:two-component system OmpR family sensor kinase
MSAVQGGLAAERHVAHRAMEDFVADAAHQLSVPLTRIRGELELVLRQTEALDGETRARLERVQDELEAHLHTCARLLLLAQLDGGVLDDALRTDELDLHEVLHELIEQLTPLAQEKALRLQFLKGAPVARVRGCRALLVEALLNLLDNAIRYTPPGGHVDIALQGQVGHVAVWVRDSGPGIPVQERALVFRRFYRGSRSRGETGTGLGLAIARGIARAHGGDVQLCPSTWGGALFQLRLPAS